MHRNVTDPIERRVEPVLGTLLLGQGFRKTYGRSIDHLLGDVDGLAENGSKSDTREDIHVVALARVVGDTVSLEFGEGRTGGEDGFVICVFHGLLECAFGLAGGVGQREDDGTLIEGAHLGKDRLGEDATNGTETKEGSGTDVVDNLFERLVLLALVVVAGEVDFVLLQLVTTVICHQPL